MNQNTLNQKSLNENTADGFSQGSLVGQRVRKNLIQALLATLFLATVSGCGRPEVDSRITSGNTESTNLLQRGTRIAAQGQLLPADGIIRLNGIPGDRVAEVLTQVGAEVKADDTLIRLASGTLRGLELRLAEQKLAEAESALAAKLYDNSQQVAAAEQELALAKTQLESAIAQLDLARSGTKSVDIANQNVERMEKLVKDPITSTTVSRSTVDQQKLQQQQVATKQKEAELAAEHSKKLADFQVTAAEKKIAALQESRAWIEKTSPLESLKTQVDLVRYQFAQTELKAPVPGKILRVDTSRGSAIGTMPLIELADTSRMICQAEISEVDIRRLAVGQMAIMTSPALAQPLQGVVLRIDPIVGAPQYRSPNPLAPVDYRVVQAIIELDPTSSRAANPFVQLQVDVSIDVVASVPAKEK